jgi:hypothetical protein
MSEPYEKCTICLDDLNPKENKVFTLSCHYTHTFHIECMKNWDTTYKGCPICRKKSENPYYEKSKPKLSSIPPPRQIETWWDLPELPQPSPIRFHAPIPQEFYDHHRGPPPQPPSVGVGHPPETALRYNPNGFHYIGTSPRPRRFGTLLPPPRQVPLTMEFLRRPPNRLPPQPPSVRNHFGHFGPYQAPNLRSPSSACVPYLPEGRSLGLFY